jgi:hypothetical protein
MQAPPTWMVLLGGSQWPLDWLQVSVLPQDQFLRQSGKQTERDLSQT